MSNIASPATSPEETLVVQPMDTSDSQHSYQESALIGATATSDDDGDASMQGSEGDQGVDDDDAITYTVVEGSSQRQNSKLVDSNGYSYTRYKSKSKGITIWRCVVRNRQVYCGCTIKQVGDQYFPGNKKHCHAGIPGMHITAKVVAQVKQKARECLQESACHIVEDVLEGNTLATDGDVAINSPNPRNLTRMANRHRRKQRSLATDMVYGLQQLPEGFHNSESEHQISMSGHSTRPLELGMMFNSYIELELFIRQYEDTNYVKYYKSDSRTVACTRKKLPSRLLCDSLRYSAVTFACVYHSKYKGEHPRQKTLGLGCTAKMRFTASADGNQLVLSELVAEHNHEHDEETYRSLPQKRRLNHMENKEAYEILKKQGKKSATEHMSKAAGKVVTVRGLHSLASNPRQQMMCYNNVQSLLDQLSEMGDSSSIVEVVTKDDGRIVGIFYQDQEMRRVYASYPQYLTVDATCKYNTMKLPLYAILALDGNGDFEIVAVFLVIASNNDNIRSMLLRFKTHNFSWQDIQIIMADKDFAERQVLQEEFPNASVQICLYHALKSFEQNLASSKDRFDLHSGKKSHCVKLMRTMAAAESEAAYMEVYEQLLNTRLTVLIDYYNSTWHSIRHEWVEGLKSRTLALKGESLTTKLESVNRLLDAVFVDAPEHVMSNMKRVVDLLREEKDHSAAALLAHNQPQQMSSDSTVNQFQQYVTPYALKYILKHLKLSWKVKVKTNINDKSCSVKSSQGKLAVSVDACPCRLWHSVGLPCRHIFAVRRYKGLALFAREAIGSRWTMEHYKSSCRLSAQDLPTSDVGVGGPTSLLSHHEKHLEASQITQQLATLISNAPAEKFAHQMDSLKQLLSIFKSGSSVKISELSSEGTAMGEDNTSDSDDEQERREVFVEQDIVTATSVTIG